MEEKTLSQTIRDLYNSGLSYRQIEKQLGCSKSTISYHIAKGQKEKTRQRTRDARSKIAKYLQQLKQDSGCADCKMKYPYWVLEFDHIPGSTKLFNVSEYRHRTMSLDLIKEEVSKCEIVCANCHRSRTHARSITTGSWCLDISEEE